jgi:hypothetical protein
LRGEFWIVGGRGLLDRIYRIHRIGILGVDFFPSVKSAKSVAETFEEKKAADCGLAQILWLHGTAKVLSRNPVNPVNPV